MTRVRAERLGPCARCGYRGRPGGHTFLHRYEPTDPEPPASAAVRGPTALQLCRADERCQPWSKDWTARPCEGRDRRRVPLQAWLPRGARSTVDVPCETPIRWAVSTGGAFRLAYCTHHAAAFLRRHPRQT